MQGEIETFASLPCKGWRLIVYESRVAWKEDVDVLERRGGIRNSTRLT